MSHPKFGTEVHSDEGIYKTPDLPVGDDDFPDGLLDAARTVGWRKALAENFDRNFVRYVTAGDRLSIVSLLPLDSCESVLEIGCGYGQMSDTIARRVTTYDGLDASIGQVRFSRVRADQEGVKNARFTAGGHNAILPYATESFDGVIMNLVLEWCAIRSTEAHETFHRRYLREIARVLKPKGSLLLSTKNRFSIRLLTGGRDEHMFGMRFGSALPRPIANAMMIGKKRQPGYLHSFGSLRDMIAAAGFSEVRPFWAAPDIREPKVFVPATAEKIRLARLRPDFLAGPSRRTDTILKLAPVAAVRWITLGLTFLAIK